MANFEKLENGEVKFELLISAAHFDEALQKAFRKNRGRYNIPGFRKGKAPKGMIERYYGEGVFYEPAFDEIYWEPYIEAVKEADVIPVAAPSVDIQEIGAGKDLKFFATVAVRPEISVAKKQYIGIPLVEIDAAVSDEQVDHEIEHERERQARFITVERPVQNGDRLNIDYSGKVDGVLFDGGTAEGQQLDIGSNQFIPGFEEQLIGMNTGEEKDISVTFPEEYHAEDLAGKEAIFTVKVNDIKEKELPALDDEFAKDVSDFDTLKEYRDDVRARMQKEADDKANQERRNAAVTYLTESIDFDIPKAMVDTQVQTMLQNMEYQLSQQGVGLEQYFGYFGMDIQGAREQLRPDAEKQVRSDLILEAVIKAEKIEPEDKDVDAEIEQIATSIDKTPEEARKLLGERELESLRSDLRQRKAMELILEKAVFSKPETKDKPKTTRKKKVAEDGAADEAKAEKKPAKKTTTKKTKAAEAAGEEEKAEQK